MVSSSSSTETLDVGCDSPGLCSLTLKVNTLAFLGEFGDEF